MNSIFEHIISEVISSHKKSSSETDDALIAFCISLLAFDPSWGIKNEFLTFSRFVIQRLILHVGSLLKDATDPRVISLKIQCQCYIFQDFALKQAAVYREKREQHLNPLKKEIMNYVNNFNMKHLKKVVLYIVLKSGMGSPLLSSVFIETKTALTSVFQSGDQKEFYGMPYIMREHKLEELVTVTSGIRLYNLDCCKGGSGIQPLPELLYKAIAAVKDIIYQLYGKSSEQMKLISNKMESCFIPYADYNRVTVKLEIPKEMDISDIEYYKNLVTAYATFIYSSQTVLDNIDTIEDKFVTALSDYEHTLNLLHAKIEKPQTVLPRDIVFPLFTKLYQIWARFQDLVMELTGQKLVFEGNYQLMKLTRLAYSKLRHLKVFDREAYEHLPGFTFSENIDAGVRIFRKDPSGSFSTGATKFEYNGYCGWKLVLTDGLLVEGTYEIGVISYKKRFYKFCSRLGLESFARDPEFYMGRVLEIARKRIELIAILKIDNDLKKYASIRTLALDRRCIRGGNHVETQIDMDIFPVGKDPDYAWNVWQLKRNALALTNLVKCTTIGIQCGTSEYINSSYTQTYDMTDNGIQTKQENYANTPKPMTFIHGLRGRKDDNQTMFNITDDDFKPQYLN